MTNAITELLVRYGADATLEDVWYNEVERIERAKYLKAFAQDISEMNEDTLLAMLQDIRTPLDCCDLIKTELIERPHRNRVRAALEDRARFGDFDVVSFYDTGDLLREKREAKKRHAKIMRSKGYKLGVKGIEAIELDKSEENVLALIEEMRFQNVETLSLFDKRVCALVLSRILQSWFALPRGTFGGHTTADRDTLQALAEFWNMCKTLDTQLAEVIRAGIRRNVERLACRTQDLDLLVLCMKWFGRDDGCRRVVENAMLERLVSIASAVGVDSRTRKLRHNEWEIRIPATHKIVKPDTIHRLKSMTRLCGRVKEVLSVYPNTNRIGERFTRSRPLVN